MSESVKHNLYLAYRSNGYSRSDSIDIADRFYNEVLDEVLEIVLKEPEYISNSQSTRQGYVTAVNDMQRAIEKLKS